MKTQLTAEESAKFIELGVSPETPIFTLTDILDILPKENDGNNLEMEYDYEFKQWWVGYNARHLESSSELIDALYSLLMWCLEKGYVK